jgi:hypothetical protein
MHAGIICVDEKTILSSDVGSLVRSIIALADEHREDDWNNRIDFLRS